MQLRVSFSRRRLQQILVATKSTKHATLKETQAGAGGLFSLT
jgi:hypothetical protein